MKRETYIAGFGLHWQDWTLYVLISKDTRNAKGIVLFDHRKKEK